MAKEKDEADDFLVGGYFTVEVDGITRASFRSADGLNVHRGRVTNPAVAETFGLECVAG